CGQVGSLMATEVVKLVTGAGRPLLGRIAVLDALAGTWREVPLRPRAHPSGAAAPAAAAPSTAPAASVAPAARPPAPAQPDAAGEVAPRDLVPLLAEGAVTLLDV